MEVSSICNGAQSTIGVGITTIVKCGVTCVNPSRKRQGMATGDCEACSIESYPPTKTAGVTLVAHLSCVTRKKHIGGGFRYLLLFSLVERALPHCHLRPESERLDEALQLMRSEHRVRCLEAAIGSGCADPHSQVFFALAHASHHVASTLRRVNACRNRNTRERQEGLVVQKTQFFQQQLEQLRAQRLGARISGCLSRVTRVP